MSMEKVFNRHRVLFITIVFFVVMGIIYSFTASNIYSSKSHVVIFRPKIENPDVASEEARNRWIWIRDGLTIKSALITDVMLRSLLNSNDTVKELAKKNVHEQETFEQLKKFVNIQFTGADENNFIVEVKAPNALLAFEFNNIIFKRIKFLGVESHQDNFEKIITELRKKQEDLKLETEIFDFYQDKIKKMTFEHDFSQRQRENSFEVITMPTLNTNPVSLNKAFIIIISTCIGAVVGLFVEYLLHLMKIKK